MRRSFLVLSAFLVCCGAVQRTPEPRPGVRDNAALVRDLSSQTVAMVARDDDGDVIPYCSGVWVSRHMILSAAHCFEDIADEWLAFITKDDVTGHFSEPRAWHLAKRLRVDETHDLALLEVPFPPAHQVATLAQDQPLPGDRLHCVGQDSGWYWTYIPGVMSGEWQAIRGNSRSGPWTQITAPVSHGMSGSGSFDESGRLIGILSMVTRAPDVAFLVHLETVRTFLRS